MGLHLKRASIWALTGTVFGMLLWSVVGATVSVLAGAPPGSLLLTWYAGVFMSLLFAGVIAIGALPAYVVVFLLWQRIVRARPALDGTFGRRLTAAVVLALPAALLLTYGFAGNSAFPFDWHVAERIFPLALVSFSGGILLPRLLIPMLRPPLA